MIIDFHSHVLPNVDHGAASLETSIRMLQEAKKAGVTKIVATPHFYLHSDSLDAFLDRRDRAKECLSNYIAENSSCDIQIIAGAEVALERGLLTLDLKRLAIENSNLILIEMPMFGHWQTWMFDMLYEIESKYSLSVVLAHVDRYDRDKRERLLDMGFVSQINAEALVSGSLLERHRLRTLCRNGLIHLIGSDAHDTKERTYSELLTASKKLPESLLTYFYENSLDLLIK